MYLNLISHLLPLGFIVAYDSTKPIKVSKLTHMRVQYQRKYKVNIAFYANKDSILSKYRKSKKIPAKNIR